MEELQLGFRGEKENDSHAASSVCFDRFVMFCGSPEQVSYGRSPVLSL